MKTIVRVTAILPDCYIRIQRLHDNGTFFKLNNEIKTGEAAAEFVEMLLKQGGRMIEAHEFIDDDDLKPKLCAYFEYTA